MMGEAGDRSVSPQEGSAAPAQCERCGATVRVGPGICAPCLLRDGLESEGEASAKTFVSRLAEADVPDRGWHLGHYEVLEEIGRGGMGVIYRARQRHSRRIVALKRVLGYQAATHETLVRFRREVEAIAQLDHPNILPIYEVDESEDGLPFFSMKYASGGSLRAAAPALHADSRTCARLIAKVARAIDYAHGQGILHRDLQPGNILLDGAGEPLVSDFGLAKQLAQKSDLTQTFTTFGTPGFIAPEQAESAAGDLTPAADVYSLGAVLFHLLAGRPPFVGENVLSVLRRASLETAPRLRALAPALDRDLETICARCLERDPKTRYQSAADLAGDLERWLEGRPIVARPVAAPVQLWRWARRNPILSGALTVCLLLGATVFWMLANQNKSSPLPPSRGKSVAVLPFQNLSRDPDHAVFAEAVQNEILTNLAKVDDLKVISRTSVMPYGPGKTRNLREIARELGVSHVVEGNVQQTDDHVRVTAQLIDAATDTLVWAKTYDRRLADLFAIQTEIAQMIAAQLQVQLSPDERSGIARQPTQNAEAFELYIRARVLMETSPFTQAFAGDMRGAVALLEKAVALDPQFALAHAELSKAKSLLARMSPRDHRQRFDRAQAALDEALRLAPEAGATHMAQALIYYYRDFAFDRALAQLELASDSLPNNAEVFLFRGLLERRLGRWEDSLHHFQRAMELNPKDPEPYVDAVVGAWALRRYPEANRIADAAIEALPAKAALFHVRKGLVALALGDLPAARQVLTAVDAGEVHLAWYLRFMVAFFERDYATAKNTLADLPAGTAAYNVAAPALLAVTTNTANEHREMLNRIRTELEPSSEQDGGGGQALPLVYFALGEPEKALQTAEEAVAKYPLTRDAMVGALHLRTLAIIRAWRGEQREALEALSVLAKIPWGFTYGDLALDPTWDNLRGDPRFEQLLADAAKPL